jgi:hypothetical protein
VKKANGKLYFVNPQIQSCENAKRFSENPVAIRKRMIGGEFAREHE